MARSTKAVSRAPATRKSGAASAFRTGIKRADFVSSFARGLDFIRAFGADRPRLSIATAADATGMNRAAARRFLLTLVELGYATSDGEMFELTPKVLELGHSYLSSWPITDLVRPSLQGVVNALKENCSMGVLDGGDIVYIARAEARRIVQSAIISVGSRIPATVSSMGRILLAGRDTAFVKEFLKRYPLEAFTDSTVTNPRAYLAMLSRIRAQGWCLVDGEFEEGLRSLAVPITDADGTVIAAINVGAPTSRATAEDMIDQFLPHLKAASRNISRALQLSGHRRIEGVLSLGGRRERD
ncbi:IclR family transcriptional regulator domain-containing protein [Bradyrhizobium liaoningense]